MEEQNSDPQVQETPVNTQPAEPAQMSEAATLGNVFFDPGETFEDLRRKPRFVMAMILMIVVFSAFQIAFVEKIGLKKIVSARLETNSRVQQMPEADKRQLIEQQSSPVVKYITYGSSPVVMIIALFIGGLLYWFGISAVGGKTSFLRATSVWVYSSFPPTVVAMIANFIVLFLKPVDDIDLAGSQQGLIAANPTMFIDLKSHPALNTLVSAIDLFAIWGLVLAAIGMSRVGKISSGASWAVVLTISLVFLAIRAAFAAFFG